MPTRLIKQSICTSDSIDMLSSFEQVMFYRLIVNCDDYGRMDARPKILASKLFPLKTIRNDQIQAGLRKLTSAELVTLYTVNGKPFLQMNTWDCHQQIRAKKSKYPSPDDGLITSDINCYQMQTDDSKCPRNPIQYESESESNARVDNAPAPARGPDAATIEAMAKRSGINIDAAAFCDYYAARSWMIDGQPVGDIMSLIRNWARREGTFGPRKSTGKVLQEAQYTQREYAQNTEIPDWMQERLEAEGRA